MAFLLRSPVPYGIPWTRLSAPGRLSSTARRINGCSSSALCVVPRSPIVWLLYTRNTLVFFIVVDFAREMDFRLEDKLENWM